MMESKNTKQVYFEDKLYASVVDINNIPDGLSFLTNDDSYIQVGTWNYDENKSLEAHFHNYFERMKRDFKILRIKCSEPDKTWETTDKILSFFEKSKVARREPIIAIILSFSGISSIFLRLYT